MKQVITRSLVTSPNKQVGAVEVPGEALPAKKVRGKLLRRAVLWGAFSLAGYLLVFLNQDTVTEYFTKGGFYALVVIITALTFSVVHGCFASYILEILGIKPLRHDKE